MKIKQKTIIDALVDSFSGVYSRSELKAILNEFETIIRYYLQSATISEPVTIKPFNGLQLTSKVLPAKEICINGKCHKLPRRIKCACRWTRHFRSKLNQY